MVDFTPYTVEEAIEAVYRGTLEFGLMRVVFAGKDTVALVDTSEDGKYVRPLFLFITEAIAASGLITSPQGDVPVVYKGEHQKPQDEQCKVCYGSGTVDCDSGTCIFEEHTCSDCKGTGNVQKE